MKGVFCPKLWFLEPQGVLWDNLFPLISQRKHNIAMGISSLFVIWFNVNKVCDRMLHYRDFQFALLGTYHNFAQNWYGC